MTRALPTHVLSSLFVALSTLVFAPTTAQVTFEENRTAKQILDSYESFERAVLNMTRDEWEVVRAWEGFDQAALLDLPARIPRQLRFGTRLEQGVAVAENHGRRRMWLLG